MAAFAYEGVLLFGVVMIFGLVYSAVTQQRHALHGTTGLQAFVFLVLGIYFTWFWSRGGQTLAMKTWHLRLVDVQGQPVLQTRAALRYLSSWIWLLPSLAVAALLGLHSTATIFGALAAGVAIYALSSLLNADRQFWHDRWCGTRIIDTRPLGSAAGRSAT